MPPSAFPWRLPPAGPPAAVGRSRTVGAFALCESVQKRAEPRARRVVRLGDCFLAAGRVKISSAAALDARRFGRGRDPSRDAAEFTSGIGTSSFNKLIEVIAASEIS